MAMRMTGKTVKHSQKSATIDRLRTRVGELTNSSVFFC